MKRLVRAILRYFGFDIRRTSASTLPLVKAYVKGGRIPWSPGYNEAKVRFICEVLADAHLSQTFATQGQLPHGFGVGFDERCVEYPWLFAQLESSPEVLLDAGSALNHSFILDHPVFEKKKLHILTLAPESNCFWQKGISYLFHDLRNVPIRDEYYDAIVCLSTLEHVGCDNTAHTRKEVYREHRSDDFILALQELSRILKPEGTLFLTVPFGVYRHFGSFQQFDQQLLSRAIDAFGRRTNAVSTFYRYSDIGWDVANIEDCTNAEYVEWVAKAWSDGEWPEHLPLEPDGAAAARCVACVKLTKTR